MKTPVVRLSTGISKAMGSLKVLSIEFQPATISTSCLIWGKFHQFESVGILDQKRDLRHMQHVLWEIFAGRTIQNWLSHG